MRDGATEAGCYLSEEDEEKHVEFWKILQSNCTTGKIREIFLLQMKPLGTPLDSAGYEEFGDTQ